MNNKKHLKHGLNSSKQASQGRSEGKSAWERNEEKSKAGWNSHAKDQLHGKTTHRRNEDEE